MTVVTQHELKCYHCGQDCEDGVLRFDEKSFCCNGCQTVFEILNENHLCEYYTMDKNPGISLRNGAEKDFTFLDEKVIRKKLLTFDSEEFAKVSFSIPSIHCVSCIWLLENLKKLTPGVLRSEVNFSRKSLTIDFNPAKTKLSKLASVISAIGYSPQINLETGEVLIPRNKLLITKLVLAGFCFGNVMLLSFPEYLGLDHHDPALMRTFSWLNLILSWPVFFYSGWGYMHSAFQSFKQKQINIDVPIAAGLIALFVRSHYDILSATGPGYLDSFTGLVFFLLIGRWFQGKTYESLSYERDFKSYFPLAVNKLTGDEWGPVVIYELKKGDTIRVRNMEIIPADSVLLTGEALIDYSFVTGESRPVKVLEGSLVYAGGRLIGQPVVLKVVEETSQSHLTSLWNHDAFKKREENRYQKLIDKAARVFTWVVLGIAILTSVYWYQTDSPQMWLVITSVLMVACPCALALAVPFTYGTMLRSFGRHKLYLKNTDVIERMATTDAVVFDKTGTVTFNHHPEVKFIGHLTHEEKIWVKSLTGGSTHPLSKLIHESISAEPVEMEGYRELPGRGIEGVINGRKIKIGSDSFTDSPPSHQNNATHIYVSVDNEPRGDFAVSLNLRKDLKSMIARLGKSCVAMLSGDQEADKNKMKWLFGCNTQLLFQQNPHDKLNFIRNLQKKGKKVMMIGDGLNDSGALKQADVGFAVTDDTGVFTPACDGIIQGDQLKNLDKMIDLARSSSLILKTGFGISFLYNAIALTFAITGHLTPIIAAILMPLSSISVVAFSSLAVTWITNRKLAIA